MVLFICLGLQYLLEKMKINSVASNRVTCILFQISFLYFTGLNIINEYFYEKNVLIDTNNIINSLYGYFLYDSIFMLLTEINNVFMTHHILSLLALSLVKVTPSITLNCNIILFLGEITNPLLNIRYFIRYIPKLKLLNKRMILVTYTIFRVLLLPYFTIRFLNDISDSVYINIFRLVFITIYSMSLFWFVKIIILNLIK